MGGLQSIVSAFLSFYMANQPLGLFLFLLVEEAGAPLWFLPGDVLIMQAGSQPRRTPTSIADPPGGGRGRDARLIAAVLCRASRGWFLAKEWQLLVTTVDVDLEDVAEVIVLAVLVATGVGVVIRRSRAAGTPLHLQ